MTRSCSLQNARHRLAAKASPGQTAHTAKLKLLDPKKSGEDWAIEGRSEGQEEDDSWSAQLAKSRRSRFAKTQRDELSMEKNTRNNIVFKGAEPAMQQCLMDVRSLHGRLWNKQVKLSSVSAGDVSSCIYFSGSVMLRHSSTAVPLCRVLYDLECCSKHWRQLSAPRMTLRACSRQALCGRDFRSSGRESEGGGAPHGRSRGHHLPSTGRWPAVCASAHARCRQHAMAILISDMSFGTGCML